MKNKKCRRVLLAMMGWLGLLCCVQAADPVKYVFNVEKKDSLIISRTVYERVDGYLQPFCLYLYTYDDQGRMIGKKQKKWNVWDKKWDCFTLTSLQYLSAGVSLNITRRNEKEKKYSDPVGEMFYKEDEKGVVTGDILKD